MLLANIFREIMFSAATRRYIVHDGDQPDERRDQVPSDISPCAARAIDRRGTIMHRQKIMTTRLCAFGVMLAAAITLEPQAGWAQWATVNGHDNQRYTPLKEINTKNVAKLGAVSVIKGITPAPSARATPVVDHGMMYISALLYVYAVDIDNGKIAWRYDPHGRVSSGGYR